MAQKKSYSRYFIILQEDEKGYALASDKLPSGYAKLEIKNDKCKISYYVQNLKKESAPYYMLLICNKKDVKKLLKLGELNIDEHGRSEVSYEYPVENVANFGVGIDKIVGAAIVRFMNSNIIPVMSGFASTDIPEWKGFTIIESELKRQEEEQEEKLEKAVEVKAEAKIEEKIEEKRQETKEEQRNIFDEYENKIEEEKVKDKEEELKVIEDIPRSEEAQIEISNNKENIEENIEEIEFDPEDERHKKKCKKDSCEIKHEEKCEEKHEEKCEEKHEEKHEEKCEEKCEEKKEYKHENKCNDNYPKDNISMLFMDVADGFEELQGICGEIKRCKWYKVPVYRPEDMTSCAHYNKYTVAYYPMINYYPYIRKHGHFILGYKHDKDNKMKYLVYGVPGTKSRIDQPFGGRTGFVTWVPIVEGEEEENSQGYWLMFYDFKNSTIVIPVR